VVILGDKDNGIKIMEYWNNGIMGGVRLRENSRRDFCWLEGWKIGRLGRFYGRENSEGNFCWMEVRKIGRMGSVHPIFHPSNLPTN